MNSKDKNLGMGRNISRRDMLHGVGAVAAASFVPGRAFADEMLLIEGAGVAYPPSLTGLRGSHVGSFEVAHQLAREGKLDWGPVEQPDSDIYDLVVVGAGISGLAAAHFYRNENPHARILILDNHDDFGGHAKRNEFDVGGHHMLGYGGSQTMEEPSGYSDIAKSLLKDIGVDIDRFDTAYDQEFYKRHGLGAAIHFNREDWGVNKVVRYDVGGLDDFLPLVPSSLSTAEAVAQMPMSDAAKREFEHMLMLDEDRLPDMSEDEKWEYLSLISYRDFIVKHMDVTEPEIFLALQNLAYDSTVGIESATAAGAIYYAGLPGAKTTGIPPEDDEPYIHHFPDGNSSVARLLVRQMIPDVAPGSTMEDIITAKFDYSKLDIADTMVRLRLNSTVVRVQNGGDPKTAKKVGVDYVRGSQTYRVQARNCVLACYNAMIPYMCPELPEVQRDALALAVKAPILYTNVALRNWQAWNNLGIGALVSTGGYHVNAMLDFPVSLGDYQYSSEPDDPIAVHMERFAHRPNEGLSKREQRRLGRYELLSTSFETMERNIREQLVDMLGEGGFDPARDIEAITVNRWAHGYAYGYSWLEDPYYGDRDDPRYPHVQGRQPYGRITIANSDAGASAMLQSAVDQAYRAVNELS